MNKFLFKSNDSDLQKMFQYIETKLDIINQNVLYTTHRMDAIQTHINRFMTNQNLQKQVDEYFDEDTEDIPEEKHGDNSHSN